MSNPLRAPLNYVPGQKEIFPSSFITVEEHPALMEANKAGANLTHWRQKLENTLDLEPSKTLVIPKHMTVDKNVHQTAKEVFATAQVGKINFRTRSEAGYLTASGIFRDLPEASEQYSFLTKGEVAERAEATLKATAGTALCMNRLIKYYPRKNSTVDRPVTREEAAAALRRCGISLAGLDRDQTKPFPLIYTEDAENLRINLTSDNGFPVGGDMKDALAVSKVYGFARGIREQAVAVAKRSGPRSVVYWVREQENSSSNGILWAVKGKAKGDYYKRAKLAAGEMRFYNAFGRQVVLNMQVATQVLEKHSRSILDDPSSLHSGIGVALVRGGAEKMVVALQQQLDLSGAAYVHVGDDSKVLVRVGEKLVCFALDCSSFDLTQHGECTLEVHNAVRGELEKIDAVAANIWYALARERNVVLVGGAVTRMKHAGPSGMPLQSKVNDMLMDVMISRVLTQGTESDWLDEEKLDVLLQEVGEGMGFKVRLEGYTVRTAATYKELLEQAPVLFIGYYFYSEDGRVKVVADLPRSLAQMPYPSQNWVKKDHDLAVLEAMRLGSIYISQGIYPEVARKAQETFQAIVEDRLEKTIKRYGDVEDKSLGFAVSGDVHGPEAIPSLSGLLAAVRRPLDTLWLEEPELPSDSLLVNLDWAGEMEEEDRLRGADRPADRSSEYKVLRVPHKANTTHPATWSNWGRPPPTAVWGPDKAPRPRVTDVPTTRGTRNVRIGNVIPGDESEEFLSDYDDDDFLGGRFDMEDDL